MVPKTGTVRDVLLGLQQKTKIDDETLRRVSIFETHNNRLHKLWHEESALQSISEFVALCAAVTPDEEANMTSDEDLVNVFQFDKEPNKTHGAPFRFVIKPVSNL